MHKLGTMEYYYLNAFCPLAPTTLLKEQDFTNLKHIIYSGKPAYCLELSAKRSTFSCSLWLEAFELGRWDLSDMQGLVVAFPSGNPN